MSVTVYVPQDTSAVSVGADDVARAIATEAQVRKADIRIVRNGSRGLFWLEPMVEVDVAGTRHAYGPVTADDVASLFESGFLTGGAHGLHRGATEEIPFLKTQDRLTFKRCGVTDPLSAEDYEAQGGLTGLRRALGMAADAIVEEVSRSGLRGRGGAGFPTGIKWRTVLNTEADQKYIVCNADEGDSGTFADRMIMEGDPFALIEGMTVAGIAVGATRGYIYLRSEYPRAHAVLDAAIARARDKGWLGADILGSGNAFDLSVALGAGAYICGEETSLLESLEGKRGEIRAKPPLPAVKGLFQKPTVVNNVLTLATVPFVLAEGAEAYETFGAGRSRGTQPFQLAGNIKHGGLVETAFGLTLRTLIEEYGGGTATGRPVRAVQVGGPLGAYLPADLLDTPLDYESLIALKGTLGHGGVVVFDDTVNMAEQARFAMEFCAVESCGKCTPCRLGSVRGVETLDKIMAGHERAQNLALLEDLCDTMMDGSLCAMGGMTPFPVLSALKYFPEDFGANPVAATAGR